MTDQGSSGGDSNAFIERELVGTVLAGRYRILKKLGEGAMGAVYLGEHLKIGRQDAIKVLRDNLATDPEALARFNRGARNVSSIRHPNVCTIYDYSDTGDGHQFLAMEFIPGETLKDVLDREGTVPMPRAVAIARQVADALQAAHEADVVHRDLKPANIMIVPGRNGTETVRVVDFDLAKGARDGEEAEVTRIGWVVGTPEYMSPEQLTGDRLEGTSDVYSLGLVFFRMITGTFPFRATSTHELILQRLTERPLSLSEVAPGVEIPPGIQAVVDRALQRSPADRYQNAAEFGRDLATALEAVPLELGAPTAPPPPAPPLADTVPQTRKVPTQGPPPVAAAPVATGPAVAASSAPRRSGVMVAGVAGLLVIGAAVGIGIFAFRGGDSAAAPQDVVVTTPGPVDPGPTGPYVPDTDPPLDPDPTTPSGGGREPGGTMQRDPAPPPETAPEVSSPRPAPGRISVQYAGAVLGDQVERMFDASPGGLTAIRDTAQMIYNLSGLPRTTRGQAASLIGQMSLELGDAAECVRWMNRALAEDAGNDGYRRRLVICQERAGQ